jgi:Tfp pilus assembly protein PilO
MRTAIRRSSWIVTVPLAAAAVAYFIFFFLPNKRAVGEARNHIKRKQDYIVQCESLARALRLTQQELEKSEAYNTAWQQEAPVAEDLAALYGRIYELAKNAGTKVTRFDPEPAVHYERISYIPLAMGSVGSFTEICGFLEGLEDLAAEIWIKDLQLDRMGGSGGSVTCELSLVVFTSNLENSDYVEQSQ